MSTSGSRSELWTCHLGVVPYRAAAEIQRMLRERRIAGELPDTMLLLEHPPTYTRGRRSADGELPYGEAHYRHHGIDVVATDRGGRVTYHGPGQLVGYPIMGVDDVVAYVRGIECALVAALGDEGVGARSRAAEGRDFTGVWVQERKIASIGVHLSRGVVTHGFAVNVDNDLEPFSWIVPCGLAGVAMTSIEHELARAAARQGDDVAPRATSLASFRERAQERFCGQLGKRARVVSPLALGLDGDLAKRSGELRARVDGADARVAVPA